MTKSKNIKRALLASVLSMMLSAAMLIGSTFAWFTDTETYGNNKIVAGNLKVDLKLKTGEPSEESDGYESIANVDDRVFGTNTKWEPGQIHLKELKVVNTGSLAVKYAVDLADVMVNFVLEPDDRYNPDTSYYTNSACLMYAIKVAVFKGSLEELKDAIDVKTGELSRDDLPAILELEDIYCDWLGVTSVGDGDLFEGELTPATGKYADTDKSEQEFVMIAYWAPEEEIEEWGYKDDDFNLKNGRKATALVSEEDEIYVPETDEEGNVILDEEDYPVYTDEINLDNIMDTLSCEFDIKVVATQAELEADGFGTDYDAGLNFSPETDENEYPVVGKD